MSTILLVALQQTDAVAAQLDRMAVPLLVLAIAAVVVGVFSVIALVASLWTMRSAQGLLKSVEAQLTRLAPKTEPLIEKMTRLTDDVRGVSDTVRRGVNDLMDTVADVNRSLKSAARAADIRVREFGAVLDVVKSEAEEVLLDTAATARGLHATAAVLRGSRQAADPENVAGLPDPGADGAADGPNPEIDSDVDAGAEMEPEPAREPTDG